MELKASFGKALAWSATGEWGRQVVSFFVFGVIARVVSPAAFGLAALASAFIVLGQVLVDQGLSDAIVQRREIEKAHLDTAFWLTLIMGIAIGALGVVATRPLAVWFKQPALIPVLSWMLLALPLSALASIQRAILRRQMNFRALAVRSLVATAAGGAVGIFLALRGYGVWALVAQTLSTSVAGIVTLWTVSGWRPGISLSRAHLKELTSFGWHIGGAGLLGFVSRRSDDIIVGFFLGPVALGYYNMAYRVFEFMQSAIVNVTGTVSYPIFAKLQSDPSRVAALFLDLTQFMSLVAFPIVVATSLLAPELVAVAFGAHWTASASVLRILVFGGIINALFIFNAIVLKTMGKPNWVFRLAVLDATGNVIAFLLFVRWGITAVAVGFVVRAYVLVPFRLWLLPRLIPLRVADYFLRLIPATIATLAMAGVILLGRYLVGPSLTMPIRLLVFGSLALVTYLGTAFTVAPAVIRRGVSAARLIVAPATRS